MAFCLIRLLFPFGTVFAKDISGPHHAAGIWPLPDAAICFALADLKTSALDRGPFFLVGKIAVGTCIALVLISQLVTAFQLEVRLRDPELRSPIWSEEIEQASEVIVLSAKSRSKNAVIVTADWGLGNQIAALASQQSSVAVNDLRPTFADERDEISILDLLKALNSNHAYLVARTQPAEIFPGTTCPALLVVRDCVRGGGGSSSLFEGRHAQFFHSTADFRVGEGWTCVPKVPDQVFLGSKD